MHLLDGTSLMSTPLPLWTSIITLGKKIDDEKTLLLKKFGFSNGQISSVDLSYVVTVKSTVEISQIFVAFLRIYELFPRVGDAFRRVPNSAGSWTKLAAFLFL